MLSLIRLPLHADSARERPLEEPKAQLLIVRSYLPGYAVITVENNPPRTVVVEIERLIAALQSL
jgi:hypothetical protein